MGVWEDGQWRSYTLHECEEILDRPARFEMTWGEQPGAQTYSEPGTMRADTPLSYPKGDI